MSYKNFIKYSILLSIVLTIIVLPIVMFKCEKFVRKEILPIDTAYEWRAAVKKALKTPLEISTLIIGDSHPAWDIGINKNWVLNVSAPGDNFHLSYFKLKNVLNQGIKPKILLLEVDYHMFTPKKVTDVRYIDAINIMPEKELKKAGFNKTPGDYLYSLGLIQFRRDLSSSMTRLLIKYQEKILENKLNRADSPTWNNFSKKEKLEKIEKRLQEQFKDKYISDLNIEYFRKIVKLCDRNNIKVLLISYPITEEYYSVIPSAVKTQVNNEITNDSILKKCTYWNYSQLYELHPEYFQDTDHLHKAAGLPAFSKEVEKRLHKDFASLYTSR